jgi:hypothetical protein
VVGLYDELAYTREMLDLRFDEMESGDGESPSAAAAPGMRG